MIVTGIYKEHVFYLDGSGVDAGMDCCHIISPVQFYIDDKVVLPVAFPGILRTSKLKNIRTQGNGMSGSCGYGDISNASVEINSLGEIHQYQILTSDKKGYEKDNLVLQRFLGFQDSDLSFGMCMYNTSVAALVNCLNDRSINNIHTFVSRLAQQLDATRYVRLEKRVWYIPIEKLMETLEEVNCGKMTRKEAMSHWQVYHHAEPVVVPIAFEEILPFTFDATTIWSK